MICSNLVNLVRAIVLQPQALLSAAAYLASAHEAQPEARRSGLALPGCQAGNILPYQLWHEKQGVRTCIQKEAKLS